MIYDGFRVTETIEGSHPRLENYPLLSGDLLVQEPDGFWTKTCPGICVLGFVLTSEQEAALEPVQFEARGLDYRIVEESK